MLQRVREWLSLILIVLLPFHAFGVTVLTKLIAGPGKAPLPFLAVWKEALLSAVLLIALVEILRYKKTRAIDLLDGLIFFLIGLAIFVSGFQQELSLPQFALGVKYDFLPLVTFSILRRVDWSAWWKSAAFRMILVVGGIVSVYGILSLFLPDAFFYWLGYSDLHSLYVADKPLAAFQQIGGSSLHRIQSSFSGPNQLGIWLLIPIALAAGKIQDARRKRQSNLEIKKINQSFGSFGFSIFFVSCVLFLVSLFLTFSRAAWIGAFVIIVMALYPFVKTHMTRGRLLASVFLFTVFVFAAVVLFPNALLRISSTRGHIERPIEALQTMIAHPLGLGLGSAGPATNRTSDTCVMLRPEDDPSWAKDRADLCVFLGDRQVQPADRACNCPILPENWYLQIGVELGWLGFVLYVALIFLVLRQLPVTGYRLSGIFYAFLAVSIAGLFLHSWEDAAIAYCVWMLIAASLPVASRR